MPYVPFDISDFTPSTTPPTTFAHGIAAASTTAPDTFGSDVVVLADVAALKALPTLTLDPDAGVVRLVASSVEGEVRRGWQLVAGTHADDVANGFALPTDYDADDNAKYWARVL